MQLEVKNLEFSYSSTQVFRGLDFHCQKGSHLWLHGQSGSGKSTFLKLISGLLSPITGEIHWDGHLLSKMTPEERADFRRRYISYGDQELHLIDSWTVSQNLQLVSQDPQAIKHALRELKIEEFENHRASDISGGQRQKVLITRMILQDPSVILLDEPTSHQDDRNTDLVMGALTKHFSGKTLIVVSHDSRVGNWIKEKVTIRSLLT